MLHRGRPDVIGYVGQGTACRAEALTKIYGRRDTAVHALQAITLDIPARAFTAIMGPSGSGKSTLLHCLAALDTPTSGRVILGRTELTALSRRQQAQVRRDRIGFVFQAFNLVPTLNALENITLPQQLAGRRPDRAWLDYVISTLGLGNRLRHRPSELSGGQQQRVALARALVGRPDVIFADEPTGNLDTTASRELLEFLRSAVDEFGQTVVTVTHDALIASYADQVLFFSDGQVVDRVLRPETAAVRQHLQYLDATPSARDQQQLRPQPDGHEDMRSRRRRRTEDTSPGRPMVGSDDEVEVARQERWLQRIREEFEVELQAAHAADDADVRTRHAAASVATPDTVQSTTSADDGWLPAERSWVTAASSQQPDDDTVWSSTPPPPGDDQAALQRANDDLWQPSTSATSPAAARDWAWAESQPEYDEWSPTQPTPSDPRPPAPAEPASSPPVYAEWQGWTARPATPPRNGRRAVEPSSSAPSGGWQVGDDAAGAVWDTVADPEPSAAPHRDAVRGQERTWRTDEPWPAEDSEDEGRWQSPADAVWGDVSPQPHDSRNDTGQHANRGWTDTDPRADDGWNHTGQRADGSWYDTGQPLDDADPTTDREPLAPAAPTPVPSNGDRGAPWPAAGVRSSPRQTNGSPLDALQSLQEQLDRLGGSNRRARAGGRAPRGDGPAEPHPRRNGRA